MNTARQLWRMIPAGAAKDRVRVFIHNRRSGPAGRYYRLAAGYGIQIDDIRFRTSDPPFGAIPAIRDFQAEYEVQPGDVVLDAGAFHGWETLFFARRVGAQGFVITVEPDPANYAVLQQNLRINRATGRVRVVQKGLWSSVGTVRFHQQGNLASSAFWDGPQSTPVELATTTIDALLADSPLARLDFVKMNIEGAEIAALQGADATIRRYHPQFAIATDHMVEGQTTSGRVEVILRDYGYRVATRRVARGAIITYTIPGGGP